MAQLALLIMSVILMLAVVAHGRAKRTGYDMLDAYFLMVMLYFGAYSLMDALINEAEGKDATLVVLTFSPILLAMLLTWFLYKILPSRLREPLRFDKLIVQWVEVDKKAIAFLATLFFGLNAYLFIEFGMLTYVGTELELLNISLPTWVGPLKVFIGAIGFSCYVAIFASIINGRTRALSLFGLLMLALMIVLCLEGRRAFIELLLIAFVMWSCARRKSIYSFKYVPLVIIMLVAFFFLSNVYQTYRTELLSIQSRLDVGEITSLSAAAVNIDATVENYRKRLAMWNFNYMITAEQLQSPEKIYFGAMAWQSLLNSIPSFMMDSKTVIDSDTMTAQLYGFEVTDYPTNDFASFLTDFGILMVVLLPIMIVIILLLVSYTYFAVSASKTAYLLVSSFCLQYLLKIENSYGDFFILIRNVLLLAVILSTTGALRHIYRRAVAPKYFHAK